MNIFPFRFIGLEDPQGDCAIINRSDIALFGSESCDDFRRVFGICYYSPIPEFFPNYIESLGYQVNLWTETQELLELRE